jgi:hypothetical protein
VRPDHVSDVALGAETPARRRRYGDHERSEHCKSGWIHRAALGVVSRHSRSVCRSRRISPATYARSRSVQQPARRRRRIVILACARNAEARRSPASCLTWCRWHPVAVTRLPSLSRCCARAHAAPHACSR